MAAQPRLGAALIALAAALAAPATATQVSVRAGTLGIGAEVGVEISRRFGARLGVNAFEREERRTIDEIEYEADVRLRNGVLLLDFLPNAGAFRLSAGALFNDNGADGVARLAPGSSYEIGDVDYLGALIGQVDGELSFDPIAPYLGFGWGARSGASGRRWSFVADLGAVYQGEPEVELRSNLPALSPINLVPALRQQFERELEKEEAKARADAANTTSIRS